MGLADRDYYRRRHTSRRFKYYNSSGLSSIKKFFIYIFALVAIGAMGFCIYMMIDAFIRQSDTAGIAHEAFNIINEYRQSNGIQPLIWDEDLEELAIRHSKYMNDTNDFSHSSYGYAENILQSSGAMFGGGVFPSGENIVGEWQRSYGHNLNLLDSRLHYGAIGVVGDYATYLAR
jgi:uncharacterized protein YkwD